MTEMILTRAQGWKDGRTVWIGKFDTEEEAHEAYERWSNGEATNS